MSCLPNHGRVSCSLCYGDSSPKFDETKRAEGDWRITANPLAWGNPQAEVVLLGFSKGPTQAGALGTTPHDSIAYKGSRSNVGKILRHIGLLGLIDDANLSSTVSELISDKSGRFHCGSLIRCTVEQLAKGRWIGTGGGMLDKFVATPFGQEVSGNCATRMLGNLSPATKLIVMFGLGAKQSYVRSSFDLYNRALPGDWHWINEVTYTNGKLTVVHVEHFAAQGRLLPSWLGLNGDDRATFGELAQQGVAHALGPVCESACRPKKPEAEDCLRSAPVTEVGLRARGPAERKPVTAEEPCANSGLVANAESILGNYFSRLKKPGEKIATFRTPNGRHLALSRELKNSIKVWVEGFPEEGMSGVRIDNGKNPGRPYDISQSRSSNINFTGSRLAIGHEVYYLNVETLGALERLATWYSEI